VALLALPSAACSSGSSSGDHTPVPTDCSPSGTDLRLAAKHIAFEPTLLCSPSGRAFTIAFDNQDQATPHNVAVALDGDFAKPLFRGQIVSGPKSVDYQLPSLPPGVYAFRCDLHPTQMTGTLVVSSGA
jgi:plastocyanin